MVEYRKDKVKIFLNELEEVKKIETEKDLQKYFEGLAITLFNQIDILAGKDRYSLAEIEFYYQNAIFKDGQYKDTYARTKTAGSLFWHLSGIDICFESNEKEGYFGGILIRALEREDINNPNNPRPQFGGPLTCKDEVLNTATEKCVVEICKDQEYHVNPKPLIRKGLDKSKENDSYLNKEYRFFREDIKSPITRKVDSFKFNTNELKKETIDRKYYF